MNLQTEDRAVNIGQNYGAVDSVVLGHTGTVTCEVGAKGDKECLGMLYSILLYIYISYDIKKIYIVYLHKINKCKGSEFCQVKVIFSSRPD